MIWLLPIVKSYILYAILKFIVDERRCQLALRVLLILISYEILFINLVVVFCWLYRALDLLAFLFMVTHLLYFDFAKFPFYLYNFWFASFWGLILISIFVFERDCRWARLWRRYQGGLRLGIEIFFVIYYTWYSYYTVFEIQNP